jgi:hypothetical protein
MRRLASSRSESVSGRWFPSSSVCGQERADAVASALRREWMRVHHFTPGQCARFNFAFTRLVTVPSYAVRLMQITKLPFGSRTMTCLLPS